MTHPSDPARDGQSAGSAGGAAAAGPPPVCHVKASHGPSLDASLARLVEPFGGWCGIVSEGERVAVKINLLRGAPPERAVSTHPETLGAVLRALKAAGARPFVADSPGGLNGAAKVARAYHVSGLTDVCTAERVQIVDVEDDAVVLDAPHGHLFRSFPVGRAFLDADAIVQVGVLKTHQLMRLTGGVKLTFGCIPGLTKAQLHVRAHRREDFADMLLDLHLAVRPRFTIIDAIIAMEGQGPGSGTPRALDSLFAARDAVALDAALADRVGFERRTIWVLAAAERRGAVDLRRPYTLAGDPIAAEVGFVPAARDTQESSRVPPGLTRFARNRLSARPVLVAPDTCTRCSDCATICGAGAITMEPLPVFDDRRCVRCYACTEVCPTAAIDSVAPRLARFFAPRL